MPDRIPADDLYARLGLAADCTAAEIDRAWRALLKRHHPDVAGPESLEAAKRINVAHDWLADASRRAAYDAARPPTSRTGQRWRFGSGVRAATTRRRPRRSPPPPPTADLVDAFGAVAPAVAAFLHRLAELTSDDRDRLAVSDPFLFAPRIREFLPGDLASRLDVLDARIDAALGGSTGQPPRILASARSFGHAIVLDAFLWLHLEDPEPLIDRMRRGWESAVGFPRYGPNTDEVSALIRRCARATDAEADALVRAWRRSGTSRDPWPADAGEYDFAALEVSAALARHDAAAAPTLAGLGPRARAAARRAFGRSAHVATLRPIFGRSEFAAHSRPWLEVVEPGQASPRPASPHAARHEPAPEVRRAPDRQERTSSSSRPTW